MNDSKISVRYSRALFQAALDKNIVDNVNSDMLNISEICKTPETREFLSSPVIPPSRKSEVLHKLLEGNVEPLTLSLIDLLIQNGRESFLPGIARVFAGETLRYKGITKAVLTTAVHVDDNVRKQISDMISGAFSTKVELEEVIDPSIIGGFVLRVDDNFIDASVKNKLRKIKKELLGSALIME